MLVLRREAQLTEGSLIILSRSLVPTQTVAEGAVLLQLPTTGLTLPPNLVLRPATNPSGIWYRNHSSRPLVRWLPTCRLVSTHGASTRNPTKALLRWNWRVKDGEICTVLGLPAVESPFQPTKYARYFSTTALSLMARKWISNFPEGPPSLPLVCPPGRLPLQVSHHRKQRVSFGDSSMSQRSGGTRQFMSFFAQTLIRRLPSLAVFVFFSAHYR